MSWSVTPPMNRAWRNTEAAAHQLQACMHTTRSHAQRECERAADTGPRIGKPAAGRPRHLVLAGSREMTTAVPSSSESSSLLNAVAATPNVTPGTSVSSVRLSSTLTGPSAILFGGVWGFWGLKLWMGGHGSLFSILFGVRACACSWFLVVWGGAVFGVWCVGRSGGFAYTPNTKQPRMRTKHHTPKHTSDLGHTTNTNTPQTRPAKGAAGHPLYGQRPDHRLPRGADPGGRHLQRLPRGGRGVGRQGGEVNRRVGGAVGVRRDLRPGRRFGGFRATFEAVSVFEGEWGDRGGVCRWLGGFVWRVWAG